jgi:hypothetical protein
LGEAESRHRSLREEVALPQRLGVDLQELVPRAGPSLGTGLIPRFLEDVDYCLPCDLEAVRLC